MSVSGLTATINILNIDQISEVIGIAKGMVEDERIPAEVREEYMDRFLSIQWESGEQEFEEDFKSVSQEIQTVREQMEKRHRRLLSND
ncbi:hypothetical protein KIH86_03590 [Paenibacillus sp. HN-1]|uniref:hypothetical protein n=1 Tax=Paenibacillus sp. CGMCC 1.18879 TaxID=2834466 RepID=UPI001CAA3CD9|nr:hypothetical protein [Paenibacillus sp. CGMCC 1.18879]MBY9077265.1 hypothetical protein [Paenibacillus sp. CGMCC 1.18879]MBY9083312.1 hypothetical protein [Paenibacillus sinensis]